MNQDTPPHEDIQIDHIRLNDGTQLWFEINDSVITKYYDAICRGETLPSIVVFQNGNDLWLADGFQRYHAAARAGQTHIRATVHQGNQRDALRYVLNSNNAHGLKKSRKDVRKKITLMLQDPEWVQWSDRAIGDLCGATGKTVASVRKTIGGVAAAIETRIIRTRHGTETTRTFSAKRLHATLTSDIAAPSTVTAVERPCRDEPAADTTARHHSMPSIQFHEPETSKANAADIATKASPNDGALAEIRTEDGSQSETMMPEITIHPNQTTSEIMSKSDSDRRKNFTTQNQVISHQLKSINSNHKNPKAATKPHHSTPKGNTRKISSHKNNENFFQKTISKVVNLFR